MRSELRLGSLVLVAGLALTGCGGSAAQLVSAQAVADQAMDRFLSAWSDGDWDPFLDMTTAEFSFWFPVGPHAGRHEGVSGRRMLEQWARDNASSGARVDGVVKSTLATGPRVVYETEGAGTAGPALNYRNWEIIVLTVSGDRISGLHEYWGSFPPG
jgi:ketosteroid isomerase-like protein